MDWCADPPLLSSPHPSGSWSQPWHHLHDCSHWPHPASISEWINGICCWVSLELSLALQPASTTVNCNQWLTTSKRVWPKFLNWVYGISASKTLQLVQLLVSQKSMDCHKYLKYWNALARHITSSRATWRDEWPCRSKSTSNRLLYVQVGAIKSVLEKHCDYQWVRNLWNAISIWSAAQTYST